MVVVHDEEDARVKNVRFAMRGVSFWEFRQRKDREILIVRDVFIRWDLLDDKNHVRSRKYWQVECITLPEQTDEL